MDNVTVDTVDFDEALYQKNMQENSFDGVEIDGKGADEE